MRVKPTTKPGQITVELEAGDDRLLEKGKSASKGPNPSFKLKRILVPIDFSDCSLKALEYAQGLAEKFEASLILLHVVEPTVYPENYLVVPQGLEEINQTLAQSARQRLVALYGRRARRSSVEFLVRLGHARSEIADTALALAADLVVMGTHGHVGLKHLLLGSTAERVVRQTPCPVLTVRHPPQDTSDGP